MTTNNSWNSPYPTVNGQLLIGSTASAKPLLNTITAGSGIGVSNGSGSITLSSFNAVNQNNIFYVGKHGNNVNSGRNIENAVLTFTQALTLAAAQSPSSSNMFAIVCLDDGVYSENITGIQYVDIFAPNASISGQITITNNEEFQIDTLNVANGQVGITKSTAGSDASFITRYINCLGSGVGVICTNEDLFVTFHLLDIEDGYGIGDLTSSIATIFIDGGNVRVNGSGSGIALNSAGGRIAGAIINFSGPTGIVIRAGEVDLRGNIVASDTEYDIDGTSSVLRLMGDFIGNNNRTVTGGAQDYITVSNPMGTSGQIWQSQGDPNDPNWATLSSSTLNITNTSGSITIETMSPSGITAVNIKTFTSSGTYTPTTGMVYAEITVIGSGGAGGGAAASGAATGTCGAGGGAGEFATGVFSAATVGASQTVTISAAGAGSSGAAGGNGGNNSVGALITAFGGTGGAASGAGAIVNCNGGAGGTGGAGGSFRCNGQTGFNGYANVAATVIVLIGGYGGSSQYGAGGYCVNTVAKNVGTAGTGYGAGGAGCVNYTSQTASTGGAGSAGIVIIREYVASSALSLAMPWNDITAASATMLSNNGYLSDNAGLVTLTLPALPAFGDMIIVNGKGAGGWKVAQNAGQSITYESLTTTVGVTGFLASTAAKDSVTLLCTTAGASAVWDVLNAKGNITVS